MCFDHPSINFLSTYPNSGPDFPLPNNAFQSLVRNPVAFLGQPRQVIPPVNSGSTAGSPPSWPCPVILHGEVPGRHLHEMPKPLHLPSFDAKEPRRNSFLPKVHDNRPELKHGQTVISAQLPLHHDCLIQHLHYCSHSSKPPIHLVNSTASQPQLGVRNAPVASRLLYQIYTTCSQGPSDLSHSQKRDRP